MSNEKQIERTLAGVLTGILFLKKLSAWDSPLKDEVSKSLTDALLASILLVGQLAGVDPHSLADTFDQVVADVTDATDKLVTGGQISIEDLLKQISGKF